jgi:hypothetical protein
MPGATQQASCGRSAAETADTLRDPGWQYLGLTWEHALGLPFEMRVMHVSDALQQPVQRTSSVYPSQRLAAIRGWYRFAQTVTDGPRWRHAPA